MTVFFNVNAAESDDDVVTKTDGIVAEADDDSPDPENSVEATGEAVSELETDMNPYGEPVITFTVSGKIGDYLPIDVLGSDNVLIDYGDNTAVSFPGERTVKTGQSVNLAELLHKPASMTGKLAWSSSKKSVATVTAAGVVKAVGAGTAVITVKCGTETATCSVVVEKAVVLNKYEITLTRKTTNPNPTTAISGKKKTPAPRI